MGERDEKFPGAVTKAVVDDWGALTEVRESARIDRGSPSALALGFEHGVMLLSALGEDDTIDVRPIGTAHGRDLSAEQPWCDAIGRRLIWGWSLTNQQGYEDGCQFEFGNQIGGGQPSQLCIQVMVAASGLRISLVGEWLDDARH